MEKKEKKERIRLEKSEKERQRIEEKEARRRLALEMQDRKRRLALEMQDRKRRLALEMQDRKRRRLALEMQDRKRLALEEKEREHELGFRNHTHWSSLEDFLLWWKFPRYATNSKKWAMLKKDCLQQRSVWAIKNRWKSGAFKRNAVAFESNIVGSAILKMLLSL